jgi:hypothetical protein
MAMERILAVAVARRERRTALILRRREPLAA